MSDVIDFLERMGQDSQLRYADKQKLESVLTELSVAQDHQAIVLLKDQVKLESLLGAQPNVCCTIEPCHDFDTNIESNVRMS